MMSTTTLLDLLCREETPILITLFDNAMSSGFTQEAAMIANRWSHRLLNGELDPMAALFVADKYLDCAITDDSPIVELRGAASYGVLTNLIPVTDARGITILPRPAGFDDNQYLHLYRGYHSLHLLWDRYKRSPDVYTWAQVDESLVKEWNERWLHLANGSEIANIQETDILGRLRFIQARLETDIWSDEESASMLMGMLAFVIEDLENTISRHF